MTDISAAWQQVASGLPADLRGDFIRLGRELAALQRRWGLFILQYEHDTIRTRMADAIDQGWPGGRRHHVTADVPADWLGLEQQIREISDGINLVQVFGLEYWLDPNQDQRTADRLRGLNRRREAFAHTISVPVLFWLRPRQVSDLAIVAPDLWSWRTGVHRFLPDLAPDMPLRAPEPPQHAMSEFDNRTAEQKQARIAELAAYLQHPDPDSDPALRVALLAEQVDLLVSLGSLDAALTLLHQDILPLSEQIGDLRMQAVMKGRVADILFQRGQYDEALRIRQQEQLPVYAQLGDIRSTAITWGKIADIMFRRGAYDEALRIHQQEELPVYIQLGVIRSTAITWGRIADILFQRGAYDEALRIRQQEELPVYAQLGDIRSTAITWGKIADIMFRRGAYDEALRIHQQEELPVYTQLGDIHATAVTWGKIASILFERGAYDEALRIRQQEELPVYTQLGDIRSTAVTWGKIADIMFQRGAYDEALRIRQQEELPVHMQIGEVDGIAAARFHCALYRLARDGWNGPEQKLIDQDLAASYQSFQRLGRPDGIGMSGLNYGQALLARGALAEAKPVLSAAVAAFATLGWDKDRAEAERLLAQIP